MQYCTADLTAWLICAFGFPYAGLEIFLRTYSSCGASCKQFSLVLTAGAHVLKIWISRDKNHQKLMSLCLDIFVYFRYQNGNAQLFDFWCKPFYQMEINPGRLVKASIVRRAVNKMTNAFRYLDHVPDFIEFHSLRISDVVQTSG